MSDTNETVKATVRFIETAGKFIWKVYDEAGSVIVKAAQAFDNQDQAHADFEAFRVEAEKAPVEVDTIEEAATAPEAPVAAPTTEQAPVEEVSTPAAPVEPVVEPTVDNEPGEVVDNPVETVETPAEVVAEPGTETAEETASTEATAEGIAPAELTN